MPILADSDRESVWSEFMGILSSRREALALTKADLRQAVDAADDWINLNAASFNAALSVSARTNLAARQKAELLVYVVSKRFVRGV